MMMVLLQSDFSTEAARDHVFSELVIGLQRISAQTCTRENKFVKKYVKYQDKSLRANRT